MFPQPVRLYSLAGLFILLSGVSSSKDVREIYAESKGSVVLIIAYDENRIPLSMGTGFYYRKNAVLTNYHVVESGSSFLLKFIASDKTFSATKLTHFSKSLDLAILHVEEQGTPLAIETGHTPEIGEKVVVIGNPSGLEGSVSEGIISGLRPVGDFTVIQITAPI